MLEPIARRALSVLIVGLFLLSGFVVLATTVRAASASLAPTSGTVEQPFVAESPIADAIQSEARENPWSLKLDPSLRDAATIGLRNQQDIMIYTNDMRELTPLLDRYAVRELPESFRGETVRDATRTRAIADGIVSTRVTVPSYAIKEIAQLPGVLGIERPLEPATADYTNLDLTEARERFAKLREQASSSNTPLPSDWGIVRSQHVVNATGAYPMGYDGSGVYVAVQDWGVDFGHPNLAGQYATVQDLASPYFGYPIMHSQMSIWNNLELFTAGSDFDRAPYPAFFSFGTASWFSDTSYQGTANLLGNVNYTTGVEYGFFQRTKRVAPNYPSCPNSGGLISRTYYVGTLLDPARVVSQSGRYHLGIHKDAYLEGIWCERVGVLVADPITPGVYDTVVVDLNDNYDFTDDAVLSVTGNPVATWDADGDGVPDLSGGILYFVGNQSNSITDEVVIAAATGTETSAALANGWIETDVRGFNLFTATMALDGRYWPSSGEDVFERVLVATAANEAGTTSALTAGVNIMTGAAVTSATLLADYDLELIYDISNTSGPGAGSLAAGTDYSINMATGVISWLRDFRAGDTVEIIYEFKTWTLDYDTGNIAFQAPPVAGSRVTATYNTGLAIPYSNITAQRQAWDLYVPGPGDMVAFHGAFNLGQEHGTWVSTNLAGVPFGNAGGIFDIYGTAPGAKIIGVDLPTSFDVPELFYFSALGYDGIPGTGDEAQIATNSWGYIDPQETGFTFIERYLYDLTTNVVPDFTILFGAGNNGPGYSTSTPPNTAPGVITVGAGTLMNYRWLLGSDRGAGWYEWPDGAGGLLSGAFGVGPYGDMVDFSSKGPTLMGTPEPDVIAAGAYGFGGRPLNSACIEFYGGNTSLCTGLDSIDLWGGTSMSTPVAAGVVALIYQAYAATGGAGAWPMSDVAKELLMSSADDHGFNPLQQGAGWVNGTAAVELATSTAGFRVSPGSLAPGTYGGVHRPAFVNMISPGGSYTQTLTVHNEGGAATMSIGDALYSRIAVPYQFTWPFANPGEEFRVLKPTGLYAANGATLIDAEAFTAWNSAEFIRITVARDTAATTGTPTTGLELFDWYDLNANGILDGAGGILERSRFSFWGFEGSRWSSGGDVYDPANRVHAGLILRIRDFGGATGPIHVTVEFYGKTNWGWANAELATGLPVGANAAATFGVTFSVPAGTPGGMYEGAVWVRSGTKTVIVPVVITVPETGLPITFGGGTPATTLYDNNGVLQGQGPGNWRQIGDSRLFWFDFTAVPAANRRMIYNVLLGNAPSEAEVFLYGLQPDASFPTAAIYGPGTMVEFLASGEQRGFSNTNYLNRELVHTAVMTAGPLALQVKAVTSVASDEPLRVEIGIMEVNPDIVRISTNKLSGSTPVTVASSVPLYDGIALVGFQQLPGNGILDTRDSVVAVSAGGTAVESISVGSLLPNTYHIAVHGWSVPTSPATFDMVISTTTAAGTVVESFTGLLVSQDNPSDPYTSSFVLSRFLQGVTALTVSIDGQTTDLDLYLFSDAPIFLLGGGNFVGRNGPTGNPLSGKIDLAWTFPGNTADGIYNDQVYASPGMAPGALVMRLPIKFSYDLNAPTFTAHQPAPASVVTDSTPGIFVQVVDNEPGAIVARGEIDQRLIRVWLDGVDITSIASITVAHATNVGYPEGIILFTPGQPLSDGPHTMIVQAGDFSGNIGMTFWTFTVDTTAPMLEVLAPTSGLATSSTSVTVMGRTDAGASVTVAGQAVFVDLAGQFSTTVALSAGSNTIALTATDAVGNTATTSVVVVYDATAPALSLLRSSAGVLTNAEMTVVSGAVDEAASVTVAGIPAMVHADGSFAVPVPLVEGVNNIPIIATDAAGNSRTTTLSVTRDGTPPVLTMNALPSETSNPTVTVSGTVETGISFVTVNGQPVTVSGGTYSAVVALSFGANVVFAEATDSAGNRATASAAVSYVPTGISTASIGLILLPVLTIVALLVGLAIGAMRARGRPPEGEKLEDKEAVPPAEEEPRAVEELPPEEGDL